MGCQKLQDSNNNQWTDYIRKIKLPNNYLKIKAFMLYLNDYL